jgi:Uma2 family endonuclease
VLLAIEVADTSLRYDRDVKAALYAKHAIPELWLVDVRGKRLTRYRNPTGGAYAVVDEPELKSPIDIGALAAANVDLAALFAD